jgi:hypothetical protein
LQRQVTADPFGHAYAQGTPPAGRTAFPCRAIVERFGTKYGFKGNSVPTVLLKNLCDAATGETLTGHLWFTCSRWCAGLRIGDRIEFDARVGEYTKGYQGRRKDICVPLRQDYRLERPTKVLVLGQLMPGDATIQTVREVINV